MTAMKAWVKLEDRTLVNTNAPNTGPPKYTKRILINIKVEMDSNTVTVGALPPHWHQWIDLPESKIPPPTKKNLGILKWHTRPGEFNGYFQNISHRRSRLYTFFKEWNNVQDRTYVKPQNTCLNTFEKTELISSAFSDHNGMKLEINYRKKWKHTEGDVIVCY